jgi:hypothetical protein
MSKLSEERHAKLAVLRLGIMLTVRRSVKSFKDGNQEATRKTDRSIEGAVSHQPSRCQSGLPLRERRRSLETTHRCFGVPWRTTLNGDQLEPRPSAHSTSSLSANTPVKPMFNLWVSYSVYCQQRSISLCIWLLLCAHMAEQIPKLIVLHRINHRLYTPQALRLSI